MSRHELVLFNPGDFDVQPPSISQGHFDEYYTRGGFLPVAELARIEAQRRATTHQEALAIVTRQLTEIAGKIETPIGPIDFVDGRLPNLQNGFKVKKESENPQPWRRYGVYSHLAVPEMLNRGQLFNSFSFGPDSQPSPPEETKQLTLELPYWTLTEPDSLQKIIRNASQPPLPLILFQTNPFPDTADTPPDDFDQEIFCLCQRLSPLFGNDKNTFKEVENLQTQKDVFRLWKLLAFVYNSHILRVSPRLINSPDSYYGIATLLTWGMAIRQMESWKNRALIPELNISIPELGLYGGRLDGLVVDEINGRPPTDWQKDQIRSLPGRLRLLYGGADLAQAVQALQNSYGYNLKLRLVEFKFAVGDNSTPEILHQTDIQNALPPRVADQVGRYLTLGSLCLAHRGKFDAEIWDTAATNIIQTVETHFFFPTPPYQICHTTTFSPEDKRKYFRTRIAPRLPSALQNRGVRLLNRAAVLYSNSPDSDGIISDLENKNGTRKGTPFQLDQLNSLREAHIDHLDPLKIVEIGYERSGQPRHIIDFTKLAAAVEKGQVQVGQSGFDRNGGFVSCLSPEHHDEHPSMMVYPETKTAKCFACGFWAILKNIPPDISIDPATGQVIIKERRTKTHKEAKNVTPEHNQALSQAQNFLQSKFAASPAREYVISRGIDPQTAIRRGVGYWDDQSSLINFLKDDCGLDDAKLRQMGFLANRKKDNGIYEPFRIRDGRITFPLSWIGGFSNFYGRALAKEVNKTQKHRKLPSRNSRIPQGVSIWDSLFGQGEMIVVFEGLFDALTADQMASVLRWNIDIVAQVGFNLDCFFKALAETQQRTIAFAYDFDIEGQKAVAKAEEKLHYFGFNGQVVNFNDLLTGQFRSVQQYDDLNTWLQKSDDASPFRYPSFRLR